MNGHGGLAQQAADMHVPHQQRSAGSLWLMAYCMCRARSVCMQAGSFRQNHCAAQRQDLLQASLCLGAMWCSCRVPLKNPQMPQPSGLTASLCAGLLCMCRVDEHASLAHQAELLLRQQQDLLR